MSNHEAGENPAHRIPKVSHATSIGVGLVGPKVRPKGVADGQQVNIPVLPEDRQRALFKSLGSLCPRLRGYVSGKGELHPRSGGTG